MTALSGIGPARAEKLARLGLDTLRDLVFFAPTRLEQIGPSVTIREAQRSPGEWVGVRGRVQRSRLVRAGGRRSFLRARLTDDEETIDAIFFNQPWLRGMLEIGRELTLYGRVVGDPPMFTHPRIGTDKSPLPAPGTWVGQYASIEGMSQTFLRGLCERALAEPGVVPEEYLPADVLAKLGLPPISAAVTELHLPTGEEAFVAARRRIAFEKVLALQARLLSRRARPAGRARAVSVTEEQHAAIARRFPFRMTDAQRSVVAQLRADLGRTIPMRRLLQGDVGCGKTAVGLYACSAIAASGGQSAFLVPTELLAEQHFDGAHAFFEQAGIEVRFLTGSVKGAARRRVLADLERGVAAVVFGTHALFSDSVRFRQLDLAVIDEQQRFGVAQRRALLDKGVDVHALLMTATPIPRTLALTLYGDLEPSLVDELPPGRGRTTTEVLAPEGRERAIELALRHASAGERVFWVVPRIEASDAGPGAEEVYEELRASPLGAHGLELVHGLLAPDERSARLERVRVGDSSLLVATTVIEVGLDVPEATLCVIDGAERFGLAQLHQLRGRVGRGPRDAHCVMLANQESADRLAVLERTSDGFEISEEDLRQRGMGDLAGLRQSGDNREGLLDPEMDVELLMAARNLVVSDASVRERFAR